MKTKKFRNAFDYDHTKEVNEFNELPSMTVPDMTMSLSEILKRYTRGGEIATLTPVYQEEDEFSEYPDFEKLDALEKLQYAQEIKESINEFQNKPKPKPEPKPDPKPDPKQKEQSDEP